MKIGIVTYSLHVGGVESVIFNLAKSFIERGHLVEVIESDGKGEWGNYFRGNGIVVKTFFFNLFTVPALHVRKIARYLKSFDFILINDAPYVHAGIGLLKGSTKVFPILHNNIESMVKNALAASGQWNKIICVSPTLYSLIDSLINPGMAVYIPNGIKSVKFVKRDFTGHINLVYIGRIEDSQKGVFLLPEIARQLKENKIDFTLEIIGDGPSLQILNERIISLNVGKIVKLRGALPHEAALKILEESHFLLMPSNYEGMPVVLLEAMSSGLIPIVSYLPGHTDICVTENITGFFGEAGIPESFVKTLENALGRRENLNKISQNAYERIRNEFCLSKMIDNYMNIMNTDNVLIKRNNKIDYSILPQYPYMPILIGKFIRKIFKILAINN